MERAATGRPIAVGDIVLVQAEVRRIATESDTLVVLIGGYESGKITYTPVPRAAVRHVLVRADSR